MTQTWPGYSLDARVILGCDSHPSLLTSPAEGITLWMIRCTCKKIFSPEQGRWLQQVGIAASLTCNSAVTYKLQTHSSKCSKFKQQQVQLLTDCNVAMTAVIIDCNLQTGNWQLANSSKQWGCESHAESLNCIKHLMASWNQLQEIIY